MAAEEEEAPAPPPETPPAPTPEQVEANLQEAVAKLDPVGAEVISAFFKRLLDLLQEMDESHALGYFLESLRIEYPPNSFDVIIEIHERNCKLTDVQREALANDAVLARRPAGSRALRHIDLPNASVIDQL